MGGWQKTGRLVRTALRTRAARVALSVTGHVIVLGGLLIANPWRQPSPPPDLPLIVDLVTLAAKPEEKPETADRPAPAPQPPVRPPVSRPAAPVPARKPAPEPPSGAVVMVLPDLPPPESEAGDGAIASADGAGLPSVDPAVGQAIAALICRRMTDREREDAGCAEQPRVDPFERPPAIALLTPEEQRIQAIRTQQLARTAGYDNFLEWYLEHDAPIPRTMPGDMLGGIGNSIFMDRRDEATMQRDRILRGGKPDWEDDIAKAHGRE